MTRCLRDILVNSRRKRTLFQRGTSAYNRKSAATSSGAAADDI